jgi:hypothetical protein
VSQSGLTQRNDIQSPAIRQPWARSKRVSLFHSLATGDDCLNFSPSNVLKQNFENHHGEQEFLKQLTVKIDAGKLFRLWRCTGFIAYAVINVRCMHQNQPSMQQLID